MSEKYLKNNEAPSSCTESHCDTWEAIAAPVIVKCHAYFDDAHEAGVIAEEKIKENHSASTLGFEKISQTGVDRI